MLSCKPNRGVAVPHKPPTHKPARASLSDGRQSAAARGYDARWRRLRLCVLRARPLCQHCHREAAAHVDHVLALAKGGSDDEGNLEALCHGCHSRKTVLCDGGFGRREERG